MTRPNTMMALEKSRAEEGLWMTRAPVPEIGPDDVLIRVKKTGICGVWDPGTPTLVSTVVLNDKAWVVGSPPRSTSTPTPQAALDLLVKGDIDVVIEVVSAPWRQLEIAMDGGVERIHAGEVILSAGAIFSPLLLMRAGIGAAADLQEEMRHLLAVWAV